MRKFIFLIVSLLLVSSLVFSQAKLGGKAKLEGKAKIGSSGTGGGGPITFLHSTNNNGYTDGAPSTTATCTAFNLAQHSTVVVSVRAFISSSATTISVTDTAGNIYTEISKFLDQGGANVGLYYAKDTAANATNAIVATFGSSLTYASIVAVEYSGLNLTAPLDVSATGDPGFVTTVTSGSFTTTSANELILAADTNAGNSIPAANSPLVSIVTESGTSSSQLSGYTVSSIQTGITVSCTGGGAFRTIIVGTFKQ